MALVLRFGNKAIESLVRLRYTSIDRGVTSATANPYIGTPITCVTDPMGNEHEDIHTYIHTFLKFCPKSLQSVGL